MIKNDELKTTGRQRIVIVVIAIFMLLSTFALYASVIMGGGSSSTTSTTDNEKVERFNELYQKYLNAVDEQSAELSSKYFDTFVSYKSRVKAYNAADITTTTAKDLVVGTGAEVTDENFVDYSAYYIGWLSDETIFDSSFDDAANPTSLKAPLEGTTNMIEGWLEGIVGMKIGGVREISIPSALAYGDQEQGSIPADSPLKFVVMLIDPVGDPEFAEIEELQQLMNDLYGV